MRRGHHFQETDPVWVLSKGASQIWSHRPHLPFLQFHKAQITAMVSSVSGPVSPNPSVLTNSWNKSSSMAFEIMFLIHHYEFIKTFFESLQQLPWHHHQKLKYFALSSMELHNSASSPSIYSHFNASLAAYIALITMTTPRLQGQNLLSNPSFRSLSATMFINNHLIPYSQLGGIWPLLHTHI